MPTGWTVVDGLAPGAGADGAERTGRPAGSGGYPTGDTGGADSPAAQPAFAHWPVPVGRVEVHHGLTYVHSSTAGGFSADDYRKIPGGGRIELLDGVAVVHPERGEPHRRLVRHFYEMLEGVCPERFIPFIGPFDVPISRTTVFVPDVLVVPRKSGPPVLVVEVWKNRDAHGQQQEWRVRLRGYAKAGVGAYWVVDPVVPVVTVHELGYRKARARHWRRDMWPCRPGWCPARDPRAGR